MDEITKMEIKAVAIAFTIIISVAVGGLWIAYALDNVPLKVYRGDTLIYQGTSACVLVESGGDTTSLRIGRGLFCLLPKAYYTGKDIRVEGSK